MTVLGAGRGPAALESVVLSLDEMQFLLEELRIDDVPVVLDAIGRYDTVAEHDAALAAAAGSLTERALLTGGEVHPELADRLRTLNRPHWVVALRLVVDGRVNRLCLAKGDDLVIVALRGPGSYVVDEVGEDLAAPLLAALGPAEPLELTGMNAYTDDLVPIFGELGDAAATARRLAAVGTPDRDAQALASALVQLRAHAEIVGVAYRDGTREYADNHIAVFDTRNGRFLATASRADDDSKWTSLSSGTPARLRAALLDLITGLPERDEFPVR